MKTLNSQIEHELFCSGASLTGFADVSTLPVQVYGNFPRAVSIAVSLNPEVIRDISKGPTKEYFVEYERVNLSLAELCELTAKVITKAGGKAEAVEATTEQFDTAKLSTRIQHKTIATLAGLGWIGKSALLITKKYGAAIRLGTVLTDAEFEVGEPVNDSQCGECRNCVEACPAKAITGHNWKAGVSRESIYNAFACQWTAGKLAHQQGISATICGICINVCPWTQKYISRELQVKENKIALKIYPVKTEDIKIAKQLFTEYLEFLKKEFPEYADLPWLIEYYRDFEEEIDGLPDRYEQPKGCILLAAYDGRPAGCVALGSMSDSVCEMRRLYIKPEFQRKGIGTALCQAVIEQAKEIGYTHLRLSTALEPAKFLYKSLGFVEIPPYLHVPIDNVAFMEFKLT